MKKNIIYIGNPDDFLEIVDLKKINVHLIIERFSWLSLSNIKRAAISSVSIIRSKSDFNINLYENSSDEIMKLSKQLKNKVSKIDAIIGDKEETVIPAAKVRELLQLKGVSLKTAILSRDKIPMKEAMQRIGVRVPLFISLDKKIIFSKIRKKFNSTKSKIVYKPRLDSSSRGIIIFDTINEVEKYHKTKGLSPEYQLEEFIDFQTCQIDGVVRNNEIIFFTINEYINSSYEYQHNNKPLIVVSYMNKKVIKKSFDTTKKILSGISLSDGVFHLEVFIEPNGELVFFRSCVKSWRRSYC